MKSDVVFLIFCIFGVTFTVMGAMGQTALLGAGILFLGFGIVGFFVARAKQRIG